MPHEYIVGHFAFDVDLSPFELGHHHRGRDDVHRIRMLDNRHRKGNLVA